MQQDVLESLEDIKNKSDSNYTTSVFLNSIDYTLVPLSLYEPGNESDYFRNTLDLDIISEHLFLSEVIENKGIVCAYTIPSMLNQSLISIFGKPDIRHSVSMILSSQFQNQGRLVYASLNKGKLLLMAVKDGNILLNNYYQVNSPQDLLYYVLLIYDQLDFDVNAVGLLVLGDFNSDSESVKLISEYISVVSTPEIPKESLSIDLLDVPLNAYYDLYLCTQCE